MTGERQKFYFLMMQNALTFKIGIKKYQSTNTWNNMEEKKTKSRQVS